MHEEEVFAERPGCEGGGYPARTEFRDVQKSGGRVRIFGVFCFGNSLHHLAVLRLAVAHRGQGPICS